MPPASPPAPTSSSTAVTRPGKAIGFGFVTRLRVVFTASPVFPPVGRVSFAKGDTAGEFVGVGTYWREISKTTLRRDHVPASRPVDPVPEEIARVAKAAFPKSNTLTRNICPSPRRSPDCALGEPRTRLSAMLPRTGRTARPPAGGRREDRLRQGVHPRRRRRRGTRVHDLHKSVCATLLAEARNMGLEPPWTLRPGAHVPVFLAANRPAPRAKSRLGRQRESTTNPKVAWS